MRLLSFYITFAITVIAGMAMPVDFPGGLEREVSEAIGGQDPNPYWDLYAPRK